jgi:hypothetical protein
MLGGYVPSQSTVCAAAGEPIGAVDVTNSSGVTFHSCSFSQLGRVLML